MYKLIIIDDDINTIEGIKNHVPLKELGLELVFTANNGIDGIEGIKKHNPDIIMSDIQMPNMSGFEMIRHIKSLNLSPAIIMLTGFNDFDYAKMAIDEDVLSYLVKPSTLDEIIFALQKAIDVCDKKNQVKTEHNTHITERREHIVRQLMLGRAYSFSELKSFEALYSLPIDKKYYCCILCKNIDVDKTVKTISQVYDVISGYIANNRNFLMLYSNNAITQSEIFDEMNKCINDTTIFAVGDISEGLSDIQTSYETADKTMEYILFFDKHGGMTHEFLSDKLNDFYRNKPSLDIPYILDATANRVTSKLYDYFENLENLICSFEIYDFTYVKTLVFNFCNCIITRNDNSDNFAETDLWLEINDVETSSEIFAYCYSTIDALEDSISSNNDKYEAQIADQIKEYIEEHYSETISLSSLAKQMYCTRSYLRIVFHKYYKTSFRTYLQNYRMKKAAELIQEDKYNLSYIAELVGYKDLKTFRETFSKHFSMLPSEYKSNHKK